MSRWRSALCVASITATTIAAVPRSTKWDLQLAPPGEPGVPFVLEGRVVGTDGRPLHDLLVNVYHTDDSGKYDWPRGGQPRLSGKLRTNVLGGYRVRTVLPGVAEGASHVHMELADPREGYRAITLSFCRLVGAGSDKRFAQLSQMLELPVNGFWAYVRPDTVGYRCDWDVPYEKASRIARPPAFKPGER